MTPRISVIMPAYNAEKYIKEAINSILNQTFKDFEFIIVNDGSTDSTKKIIESYIDPRIKIINHNINQGIYSTRSDGLKAAQGEFVAVLDSDDIAAENRLEEQLDFMNKNPEIAVVGSWMEAVDADSGESYILKPESDPVIIKWMNIFKNQVLNSSSFFRRNIVDKIGYYRKEYEYAEDYDLWSRILISYKISNVPKVLVKYRIRSKSVTRAPETRKAQKQHILEIIFNNINYYINLNRKDFKVFSNAVKWAKISNFKDFIEVRKIYKDLFSSYVKKEKFSKIDIKKILPDYRKKQKAMFRWYIKHRFPNIYNLCKNLSRN